MYWNNNCRTGMIVLLRKFLYDKVFTLHRRGEHPPGSTRHAPRGVITTLRHPYDRGCTF